MARNRLVETDPMYIRKFRMGPDSARAGAWSEGDVNASTVDWLILLGIVLVPLAADLPSRNCAWRS
jgi:hypothetical protein